MKRIFNLIILLTILFAPTGYSQDIFPVKYRIEKQAMSTPISNMEEVFFSRSYYSKPINVLFDGTQLHMYYDNNATFIKKQVLEVESNANFDDDETIERRYFTFNDNSSDTIMFVVDFEINYVQIVLPTKNSKGEKIGYTSYKKYMEEEEFAMK